jgi:hypothetical protein
VKGQAADKEERTPIGNNCKATKVVVGLRESQKDSSHKKCVKECRSCSRHFLRSNATFNDAENTVGFVDGHVSFLKIFFTAKR